MSNIRKFEQGNTYLLELVVLDSLGNPRDLSNTHDIIYRMADASDLNTIYVDKNLLSPYIEVDGLNGIVTVKLTNDDTKDLPAITMYHEVFLCDRLGNVITLLSEGIEIVDKIIVDC